MVQENVDADLGFAEGVEQVDENGKARRTNGLGKQSVVEIRDDKRKDEKQDLDSLSLNSQMQGSTCEL